MGFLRGSDGADSEPDEQPGEAGQSGSTNASEGGEGYRWPPSAASAPVSRTGRFAVHERPVGQRICPARRARAPSDGAGDGRERANAWTTARRNALNRLSEEALQVGADVVVGVELRRGEHDLAKRTIDYLHGWGSHVIESFAIGTAIVPTDGDRTIEPPTPVLDLNGR